MLYIPIGESDVDKKPINGFDGYFVDSNANIYGKNVKLLKLTPNKKGYKSVTLIDSEGKRKTRFVHTIVAEAFIPNPENKPTVNHINGVHDENYSDNLEWATHKEQTYHAIHTLNIKYGENSKRKIIGIDSNNDIKYIFDSIAEAVRYFSPQNFKQGYKSFNRALTGKRKTYKKCIWKYTKYYIDIK